MHSRGAAEHKMPGFCNIEKQKTESMFVIQFTQNEKIYLCK